MFADDLKLIARIRYGYEENDRAKLQEDINDKSDLKSNFQVNKATSTANRIIAVLKNTFVSRDPIFEKSSTRHTFALI